MEGISIIIQTAFVTLAVVNALTAMGAKNWHSFGGWACAAMAAAGLLADSVIGGAA